ncbi:universal stress protein [Arthrobacter sp. BF1]|uniref:universal stress protein n=1 Tax=Arthrobacter sp. BF1 TaxID=2821145 RepID=UPI001C4E3444|nr:universal stress protein [Arthrobacter sp. BF1]
MTDATLGTDSSIVVGVDGSPESILALRWAKTLASTLGCTIMAISAWHLETVYGPYPVTDWDGESEAHQVLNQALGEAFGGEPPVGMVAEVRRGRPVPVLLNLAQSAQMLIVGSRGHGGFAGMLLGSVSSACAAHARCPVLVVHGAQQLGEGRPATVQESQGQDVDEPTGNI